jgi:hypothetical protein
MAESFQRQLLLYGWLGSVILACLASPLAAQTPAANWLNVKSFGAKGDGTTCDQAAILAAANAAATTLGGATVYFPVTAGYRICTDLVLPDSAYKSWIRLWFDGPLYLAAKVLPGSGYVLHGGNPPGGSVPSFSTEPTTIFGTWPNGQIYIHGKSSVRIENIDLGYGHGIPLVAIDGQSSNIVLHQVYINMGEGAPYSPAVSVIGGFRIYFEGGAYNSSTLGTQPSILISSDPVACNAMGIVRIKGVVLAGHGVKVTGKCGIIAGFTLEDNTYEASHDALLTVENTSGGFYPYIYGFTLRDNHLADEVTKAPCVDARGGSISGFSIFNCFTDTGIMTTGSTIKDLEVWSSIDWRPGIIAQPSYFIYHGPSGIKDTMPKLP